MSHSSHPVLTLVFLDVAEHLAFMFGDPISPDSVVVNHGRWARVSIHSRGCVDAEIELCIPEAASAIIAANILGLEPEELSGGFPPADSLKELINVVAGHLVPALVGNETDYTLDVPHYDLIGAEAARRIRDDAHTACFSLDDHDVMLRMVGDGE